MTNEQVQLMINQVGIAFAIILLILAFVFCTYLVIDGILTARAQNKWYMEQTEEDKKIIANYKSITWKRKDKNK